MKDDCDLSSGVDFLRANWDEKNACLAMTMRTWDGNKRTLQAVVRSLQEGSWEIYQDGELLFQQKVRSGGDIELDLSVGGDELDVALILRDDSVAFK